MNKLEKIVSELKPSGSVYRMKVDRDYLSPRHIRRSTSDRHQDFTEHASLVRLACENVYEYFVNDKGVYKIGQQETIHHSLRKIHDKILSFLENKMPQKYPKETKMYKFFRDQNIHNVDKKLQNIYVEVYSFLTDISKPLENREDQTMKILKYVFAQNG